MSTLGHGARDTQRLLCRIPAFERYVAVLRLERRVRCSFLHGGMLRGLLSAATGLHDLDGIVPFGCESGRVFYEAGDHYRIGITLVGDATRRAGAISSGLSRVGSLPLPRTGPPPTLWGNFQVEEFRQLSAAALEDEIERLKGARTLTLRWLSPLRLLRPVEQQIAPTRYINRDCLPAAYFLDKLHDRLFQFITGEHPAPEAMPSRAWPESVGIVSDPHDLHWVDMPVKSGPRRDPKRPNGYTLGGVLGSVRLEGTLEVAIRLLVTGQYLHVGESTSFGLGRYCIEECGGDHEFERPAESALYRAARRETLREALSHLRQRALAHQDHDPPAGEDWDGVDLSALGGELERGSYRPGMLRGVLIPKKSGGRRTLAVPDIRDRIAQRAAVQVLAPAIDGLLEECSFAYRKGLSRAGAARAISRAYSVGFRFVLDADIESFFDSVDWLRLFAKLRALLPMEPLAGLLETWVKAPVRFEGKTLERRQGLPQGSPISPMLANLFLDEFDEELLARGLRLVRYADNFVILCRDRESAERARLAASETAKRLGLTLNADKTDIQSFETGFNYLGYLFCRSVAIETHTQEQVDEVAHQAGEVSRLSWLATVEPQASRPLTRSGPARMQASLPEVMALATAPTESDQKRPCILTDPTAKVRLSAGALAVAKPGQPLQTHPIGWLAYLMICGRIQLSTTLVLELAGRGVPIHYCSRTGQPKATCATTSPDWAFLLEQARFAEDPSRCLAIARSILSAKIHNDSRLISRFALDEKGAAAGELRALRDSAFEATSLETLLGLEGRAAVVFFGLLKQRLDPIWRFGGRCKHPPTDPVNSMLSFGYTILYNQLTTMLLARGFNPRTGILHQGRGAHQALASDLMEEFRHLVEAEVWDLIGHRRVQPEDFSRTGGPTGGVLMLPRFRAGFIEAVEERLDTSFTPEGEPSTTYRLFMDRQVLRLREAITGRGAPYVALRIHA